jgi:hypothetical protein
MIALSDSGYPAGTIVVAAGIQPRYYEFQLSLEGLGAPVGTKLHIERSCDIAQNFNNGVKKMIGDWIWFLGDDHSFSPTLLLHLLKHNVDVVVPITPCKGPPYAPCIMHGINGEWHEDMPLYHWDEISGPGLLPLPVGDFIGQAGMLVRKHVLDKIGYPWFKCGQIDPGRLQEDLTFCRELQRLGYTVNIDQEVIFDHHVPMRITARKVDGYWIPGVGSGAGTDLVLMPYSATKRNPPQDSHDFNSASDPRIQSIETAAPSSLIDAGVL